MHLGRCFSKKAGVMFVMSKIFSVLTISTILASALPLAGAQAHHGGYGGGWHHHYYRGGYYGGYHHYHNGFGRAFTNGLGYGIGAGIGAGLVERAYGTVDSYETAPAQVYNSQTTVYAAPPAPPAISYMPPPTIVYPAGYGPGSTITIDGRTTGQVIAPIATVPVAASTMAPPPASAPPAYPYPVPGYTTYVPGYGYTAP